MKTGSVPIRPHLMTQWSVTTTLGDLARWLTSLNIMINYIESVSVGIKSLQKRTSRLAKVVHSNVQMPHGIVTEAPHIAAIAGE